MTTKPRVMSINKYPNSRAVEIVTETHPEWHGRLDFIELSAFEAQAKQLDEEKKEIKRIMKVANDACMSDAQKLATLIQHNEDLKEKLSVAVEALEELSSEYAEDICDIDYNPHQNPAFKISTEALTKIRASNESEGV